MTKNAAKMIENGAKMIENGANMIENGAKNDQKCPQKMIKNDAGNENNSHRIEKSILNDS